MSDELPPPPAVSGQVLDAQLHILDRQVIDSDGQPVSAVDDIELSAVGLDIELDPTAPPVITSLLNGPSIGIRVFGGRVPPSRLIGIGWRCVSEVAVAIHLTVRAESLDVTWTERWLSARVIGRIPGAHHDPE